MEPDGVKRVRGGSYLLSASLAVSFIVLNSASASAEDGGVVLREVIQERNHLSTIYEATTPGSVIPRTFAVIQPSHVNRPALEDAVHIRKDCELQHYADGQSIGDCIRHQISAWRELTQISEGVAIDAGLSNIIAKCLSASKLAEGYHWQAALQCYDEQRKAFAQIYGR